MLDIAKAKKLVDQCWADEIVPTSVEYIKIPNKSPAFDPDWAAHGYMDDAVALLERWARAKLASVPGVSSMSSGFPGAPRSSSSRSPKRARILRGGDEGAALWGGDLDRVELAVSRLGIARASLWPRVINRKVSAPETATEP